MKQKSPRTDHCECQEHGNSLYYFLYFSLFESYLNKRQIRVAKSEFHSTEECLVEGGMGWLHV